MPVVIITKPIKTSFDLLTKVNSPRNENLNV